MATFVTSQGTVTVLPVESVNSRVSGVWLSSAAGSVGCGALLRGRFARRGRGLAAAGQQPGQEAQGQQQCK